MTLQEQYDDAMFAFSSGDYDDAIAGLKAILAEESSHFDAQLALGMAFYRKGDYAAAIVEGHKAEKLKPKEQLVHTNLSLFYMKAGDKKTAEHHGLQARIAGWRDEKPAQKDAESQTSSELEMAKPAPQSSIISAKKIPDKFPDMPWKRKP
jgi:Flp pilus assembly protein TadD